MLRTRTSTNNNGGPAGNSKNISKSRSGGSFCNINCVLVVFLVIAAFFSGWSFGYQYASMIIFQEFVFDRYDDETHSEPETQGVSDTNNNNNKINYFSGIKRQQIENYKQSNALILNVHITHHAGTVACHVFKKYGPVPSFVCLTGKEWPKDIPNVAIEPKFARSEPWKRNETAYMIERIRQHYHMISWEFGYRNPTPPLSETNWEDPNLVSIIIMRHPIDRLLAGDRRVQDAFGFEHNRTREQWWTFANSSYHTNNYALKVLSGRGCCNGRGTKKVLLEKAKKLISRFTFILDQDCLTDGLLAVVSQLQLPKEPIMELIAKKNREYASRHRLTAKERINDPALYDLLQLRNRMDIALYEWAKTKSIVNCKDVAS